MKKSQISNFLDAIPGDPEIIIMDLIPGDNLKKAKRFIAVNLPKNDN